MYQKSNLKKMIFDILNIRKINEKDILNIYLFGSQVYKTSNNNSDYDFLIVINNNLNSFNNIEINNGLINIHLITLNNFIKNVNEMKIKELECLSNDKDNIILENNKIIFNINLNLLRKNISSKANNSYVKAKKKMILQEEDSFIGLKSLFHSIRILDFGYQLATNKKIENFSSVNNLWKDMVREYYENNNWDFFNKKYKSIFNKYSSKFKIVAPKK